jgi:hypothetical protein
LRNLASETPDPDENRLEAPPAGGTQGLPQLAARLGIFASSTMLILWVILAVISRDYPQSTTPEYWLRIAEIAALAALGLLASMKKWPLVMLVIFLASFFPTGIYLLGVPSIFRLIGVADLLYLVASLWLLLALLCSFLEKDWVRNLRNWMWISSSFFALLAGLLKVSLFPQWNPPFIFPMITAFGVSALVWWKLFLRSQDINLLRGIIAGVLIGGLTPPLMWLPYGLFLTAMTPRPLEALGWSLAYAFLMLIRISSYTAILGAGSGVLLAALQKKAVHDS